MKRALPVALLVLVAVAAYFLFRPAKTPTGGSQPPASVPETSSSQPLPGANPATAASTPEPGVNPATATSPASAPTNAPPAALNAANPSSVVSPPPGVPPKILVQNVRRAIRQYGAMFGGNPVGTNPEITAQLAGKNPKGVNFINADAGMRVNDQGEMVDSWGTPLFFHQLSGTDTEVRSAGPDKVMWTSDDLVSP
jgi:hypothetical protein